MTAPILCRLVVALSFATATASAADHAVYFVDPVHGSDANPGTSATRGFLTLEKARDAVRTRLAAGQPGDITVYLRGGTYRLAQPLVFGPEDSGRPGAPLIYKAYENEHPVLSGGRIITGWTLHDAAKNIWVADAGAGRNFRQLYVNGRKALRTTSPAPVGATKNATGYAIHDTSLGSLQDAYDVEVVTHPHPWQVERLRVESITADRIVLSQPGLGIVTAGEYPGYGPILRMENAYEWITEPGNWYLDRKAGKLYYKPRAGENMATARVEAPQVERLVLFQGSGGRLVSNIQLSGLTFTESTWLAPSDALGLISSQANQLQQQPGASSSPGAPMPVAAIEENGARNVVISGCEFRDLGGQGINVLRGSQDDTISRCDFHDLAAAAVQIGSVGEDVAQWPADSPDIVSGITAADCRVHHVNTEYPSGCGIFLGHVRRCSIVHNELFDLPYTAISVGWGWTNAGERAAYRTGNLIASNRIHDYVKDLVDAGGVYCNGWEKDGLITRNYIYDQHHDFALIYLDDGSTNWTVTDNVLRARSTGKAWLLYKGADNHARGNFTDSPVIRNEAPMPGGATCTVEGTTVVQGESWPAQAQAIMDSAGPR